MSREWTFTIDQLGRPWLANAAKKMHPKAETRERILWRDATIMLALAARISKQLACIRVTAQARYKTFQSPSDCDATAPSVKGVIDGLVMAGIIADDCPPYVASVTYLSPLIGTGLPDALIVTVTEVEAADRILWNRRPTDDGGDIDEVVIHHPKMVHVEQMDDRCWWIGVYLDSDRYWMGDFVADSRGRMRFIEQENAGVDWAEDASHEERAAADVGAETP